VATDIVTTAILQSQTQQWLWRIALDLRFSTYQLVDNIIGNQTH